MPNPPAAQKDDWERALEGIEFPIATVALRRVVHDRGGLDREVLDVLDRLAEDEFETSAGLIEAIRGVYSSDGVEPPL